jgi:hypothetical protein
LPISIITPLLDLPPYTNNLNILLGKDALVLNTLTNILKRLVRANRLGNNLLIKYTSLVGSINTITTQVYYTILLITSLILLLAPTIFIEEAGTPS